MYAASGAAALIYEVSWVRLLSLQLGHTVAAASTVLAAFMGGLALGSALGGRLGDRLTVANALYVYAAIELAIAALALLLPLELRAMQPALARLYADGNSHIAFPLARLLSSLWLLALPAIAMGATFPVASRIVVTSSERAASDAARLYAANTAGAACGAILAGFMLLPTLGLSGSTRSAVLLNVAAAAAAWWISTQTARSAATPRNTRAARASSRGAAAKAGMGLRWTAAMALGLSGFASLSLQVVWTRVFALMLGPTVYAFSLIVTIFIAGLALGSTVGAFLAARSKKPLWGLAVCLLLSVGLACLAVAGVDRALYAMADIVSGDGVRFGRVIVQQTILMAALLGPMTVAFGAAFPFAVVVGTRAERTIVSDLGRIYAVNTIGAIAGALLTGFVLIPLLGLHNTIRAVTVVVATGTLTLLVISNAKTRMVGLAGCVAVLALAFGVPSWNEMLLSSGAYKYAAELSGARLSTWLGAGRLLYYREGADATVSVREAVGSTSLSIDGKVDASNVGDMLTQRLLAHLPLLLHPDARSVAIIGLGSGVTLGSALRYSVTRVDALEISPEVVDASLFFEAENHRALADPRTRLIMGDGRSHFMLSRSLYDVVISEPSNPWMAGVASLFTHEFFESVRSHLTPGGIFCQWAHTYDISDADLRSIVRTFLASFPNGALWLVGEGDVLLVGSSGSLDARLARVTNAWNDRDVAEDLAAVGIRDPFAVLSLFVAEGQDLAEYAAGAQLQRDDRIALEFSVPRSVFGPHGNRNDDVLIELRKRARAPEAIEEAIAGAAPASWRNRGWMLLQAEAYESAARDFRRTLESDPADSDAYEGLRRSSIAAGEHEAGAALTFVTGLASDRSNIEAGLALTRLLAAKGDTMEAIARASELARRHPDSSKVLEELASLISDARDIDRLRPLVERMRRDAPASEGTRYHTASLLFMEGRPDLAVAEVESIVRENPRNAQAQNLLGAALASLGDRDRARRAFDASLRADRLSPSTYVNLAMLEMETGNTRIAARRYAEALILNPESEAAQRGLAEATAQH